MYTTQGGGYYKEIIFLNSDFANLVFLKKQNYKGKFFLMVWWFLEVGVFVAYT